jgi:hypothetical protein
MTEPTPTEPVNPTALELDRMILDAYRELTAAIRARPRDEQRIADARGELEDLQALKAQLYPNG